LCLGKLGADVVDLLENRFRRYLTVSAWHVMLEESAEHRRATVTMRIIISALVSGPQIEIHREQNHRKSNNQATNGPHPGLCASKSPTGTFFRAAAGPKNMKAEHDSEAKSMAPPAAAR